MKERISISLDEDTVKKIKAILGKTNFRNQSHFVETAIIDFVGRQELELKELKEDKLKNDKTKKAAGK